MILQYITSCLQSGMEGLVQLLLCQDVLGFSSSAAQKRNKFIIYTRVAYYISQKAKKQLVRLNDLRKLLTTIIGVFKLLEAILYDRNYN